MLRPPKRSLRRHHAYRMKRRAAKRLRELYEGLDDEVTPRDIGLYAATPKVCSCWMCGNPRRFDGEPTWQEVRNRSKAANLAE